MNTMNTKNDTAGNTTYGVTLTHDATIEYGVTFMVDATIAENTADGTIIIGTDLTSIG